MKEFILSSLCLALISLYGQTSGQVEDEFITILFWNVENLYDPFDDSLTMDDEFTPEGIKHWTWKKFQQKLNRLYKVMAMADEWNPPDIIGLCEVENKFVLRQLVENTPLSKYDYRIIHYDSPDPRGIDVSMMYLPDSFEPLFTRSIRVPATKSATASTRDILYVKGAVMQQDTLNLFINHWPSRYQGEIITAPERAAAAGILRKIIDSLLIYNTNNRIIIFGDFNDEPSDRSISVTLGAIGKEGDICANTLYNLSLTDKDSAKGTQKYQGKWFIFDQFIVSGSILLNYDSCAVNVLDFDFLMEEDEGYTGLKPFRTYNGYQYRGGFSDHLPVILNIK